MHHLHLKRNLRSLAFIVVVAAVLAAIGMLWWVNHTGLPESWRTAIEREISKQGAEVKIERLSYHPLRGIIASKVRVFADAAHLHEISRLESVILNFDKTKLARGVVHITKIELKDAQLVLPLDPNDGKSAVLEISGANGILILPGGRRLEIQHARGRIAGIEVSLDARLTGYQSHGEPVPVESGLAKRRELLIRVIDELKKWRFDRVKPPQLRVFIEGDENESAALTAKLELRATRVGKNHHELKEVFAEASIAGDLLTVTALHAADARGTLDGRLDYDVSDREGRFDLRSSLEIPHLLEAWLGLPALSDVRIRGLQTIEAAGEFHMDASSTVPHVQMTGRASCESVKVKGVKFEQIQSAFSWKDGDLFFRDICLTRADGEAHGKALIQWPLVRLAIDSTFPLTVYRPFFVNQNFGKVLNHFDEHKDAAVKVSLEGGFNINDATSWALSGRARVDKVSYRKIPVNSAECRLSLSHHELDFSDGTVVFNYQNYALREAFNGPKQGTVKVGRVRYDADDSIVEVEGVTGSIWAAPMVRLFAPKIADSLEIYRFHRPPEIQGSGVVDLLSRGLTTLDIAFRSEAAADYRFLGEALTLEKPSAKVSVRGDRVIVDGLNSKTFNGSLVGRFDSHGNGKLDGELSWTRLDLLMLASTYGFQIPGGGDVTGRIEFSLTDGRVETMAGEGLFALEKTELFSVPIFGPLSPLISGVLNDRGAGFQRAKNALCTFQIKDGVLSTQDFQTATTALAFAGDGTVDLKEKTLDLTMRMNARGLLSLITLPLRPFYGMFQFRGTGPLKNPKWQNVMFTVPSEAQNKILAPVPKAKPVAAGE